MSSSTASYPSSSRAWLEQLVSFNTVSSNSNLALIDYVDTVLAELAATPGQPLTTERIPNDDGSKTNLLVRIGPDVEGGVVLSGHTDVVPVEGQQWSSDPFTVTEREGRLYGRGTADMKGFIACCLAQVPTWRQLPLQRPILLALSYDEEIGCVGAPRMIERLAARSDRPAIAIIGEPTMLQAINRQKGITDLMTRVTGLEAHSSQIPDGVSAIHVAGKLISKIDAIMEELSGGDALNPAYNVPYSTLHVGTIKGGTAVNIMAGQCAFEWEIRDLPEYGFDTVFERFQSYASELEADLRTRAPSVSITTTQVVETVPGLNSLDDAPALRFILPMLENGTTGAVAFATEAGQFQRAGFSAVICGPGNIAVAHKPDEYLELEQLDKADALMQQIGEAMTRA